MNKEEIYQKRILEFGTQEEKFRKITSKFPLYRLMVFLAGAFAFYFAFAISIALAIGIALLFLICFVIVTKYDLKYNERRKHFSILKKINEQELKGLLGDYKIYNDGSRYQNPEHPYASDLDIFGRASVFQYINRTTSHAGSGILAEMLQLPAKLDEVNLRQDAIRELDLMIDWRQELQASGIEFEENLHEQKEIFSWLKEDPCFLHSKVLSIVAVVLPLITIGLL
nr:hypothetical protein [Bacteroidota bacterium]